MIHHAELLEHLVRDGQLTPGAGYHGTVTYHDPCYLGRHNRIFDEPAVGASTPSRGPSRSR